MRYHYFITSAVRQREINRDNGEAVNSIIEKFNKDNSSLTPTYKVSHIMDNVWLCRKGDFRLVWMKFNRQMGDEQVEMYVLRKAYLNHDLYEKEINDATKKAWINKNYITDEEQTEIYSEFDKFLVQKSLPALPEEFWEFEDKRIFDKFQDGIVYEMPEWTDNIRKIDRVHLSKIQERLVKITLKEDEFEVKQHDNFLSSTIDNKFLCVYRYEFINEKVWNTYLLKIQAFSKNITTEDKEKVYHELEEKKYNRDNVKELQNYSSKCYPDYYTYELESWSAVEADDLANLALSEEEIKILQDIKYPFYVSGLAGSGKSTVLYYLYANIYKYQARKFPQHKMLFLSYNSALVDKARMAVENILKYHSTNQGEKEWLESDEEGQSAEQKISKLHKTFMPFRLFLKSDFLDPNETVLFNEEKHITYEKFVQLYAQSPYAKTQRNISPAALWSIIRSFIKGRSIDYFTPEMYSNSNDIVRDDKSVDMETYNTAYKIWNDWYRPLHDNKGYWDDLDLVRYILTKRDTENLFNKYTVIFCDEAQDFTKIEIDLILKLSIYPQYDLSLVEDNVIPIAFAGDPNQTINPTGFRWAGTKAIFTKAFEDAVNNRFITLQEQELSRNYRSRAGIVKLANAIQSLRYKHFDSLNKSRKLQTTREDNLANDPDSYKSAGFYSLDKDEQQTKIILENLTKANIITNEEGELGELAKYTEITNNDVKLNTAMGTKGLEYKAVMLYRFCDDPACKLFASLLNEDHLTDAQIYEIAHFFTKLYIAVSRARNELFVVDTDENYDRFWKYFTDKDLWEFLMHDVRIQPDKRKLIGHLTIGDIESMPQRLSDTYDPEDNGRQCFEKAIAEHSALIMGRAQDYFLEARLQSKADECAAYIALYEGDYDKAGEAFMKLRNCEAAAIDAFWQAQNWAKMAQLIENIPVDQRTAHDNIRLATARYELKINSLTDYINRLATPHDFQESTSAHPEDNSTWNLLFTDIKKKLKNLETRYITPSLIDNLLTISSLLPHEIGKDSLKAVCAELCYKAGEFINKGRLESNYDMSWYEQAITIWENNNLTDKNIEYLKAKKTTSTDKSQKIYYMWRLGDHKNILSDFADIETASCLDNRAKEIIFSLLRNKDYTQAVAYPYPTEKEEKWSRLYDTDSVKFLNEVLLKDFTEEKFSFFERKISEEEQSIFVNGLKIQDYQNIFMLEGKYTIMHSKDKPYWVAFITDLKDLDGRRAMLTAEQQQYSEMLNALDNVIKLNLHEGKKVDSYKISCFIELLFNSTYNFDRTRQYLSTLYKVLNQGEIWKADFRLNSDRNKYYTVFNAYTARQLDELKDRMSNYGSAFVTRQAENASIRRAEDDIRTACRIYELGIKYNEHFQPDYDAITEFYKKYVHRKNFAPLNKWLSVRLVINSLMVEYQNKRASYAILKSLMEKNSVSHQDIIDSCNAEEANVILTCVNSVSEDFSMDCIKMCAEVIYKHKIEMKDIREIGFGNDVRSNLEQQVDIAIEQLTSDDNKRLDIYNIKLMTYVWEALCGRDYTLKKLYDLIYSARIARVESLQRYLKQRALRLYATVNIKLLKEKEKEFGYELISTPPQYPIIEKERELQIGAITEGHKKEQGNAAGDKDQTDKSDTKSTTDKPKKTRTPRKSKAADNPAKQAELDMVRKMKAKGMDIEMIISFVSYLSPDEVRNA